MIELGLVFGLGMTVAGMIWLIMLPAFWRRATRLARERLERALPMSLNEIVALRDQARAESAVDLARMAMRLERAEAQVAAAKAEASRRLETEARLLDELAAERRRVLALEAEHGSLSVEIQTRDLRIADLKNERDGGKSAFAGLERQIAALQDQQEAITELAETRRVALDEARVLAERARESLAVETQRNAQLRADLQARTTELRELERKFASLENGAVLQKIRGGEETYQSTVAPLRQKQAG